LNKIKQKKQEFVQIKKTSCKDKTSLFPKTTG
jgi:hypothetical protein